MADLGVCLDLRDLSWWSVLEEAYQRGKGHEPDHGMMGPEPGLVVRLPVM